MSEQTTPPPELAPLEMLRFAELSADRVYRYSLSRLWGDGGTVNWLMLNPSTADETVDDPTIRRCIGFAKAWGFGGIVVTNLFAFRSKNPADLMRCADPVGPENDDAIMKAATDSARVIAAWGNDGSLMSRDHDVRRLLDRANRVPHCLGRNASGQPKHPLYLRADSEMVRL